MPEVAPIVLSINRLENRVRMRTGATDRDLRISCVGEEFKPLLSQITTLLLNGLRRAQGLRAFGAVPTILLAVTTLTG